jgi:hypothetical protein
MSKKKMQTGFWWRNFKERDHLEDLNINIIDLIEIGWNGVN